MKKTDIEKLKSTLDIVNVIRAEGFDPKKNGQGWKINCPFHEDKTPSFSIDDKKQLFHCFGCGVSGDVIRFIELKRECSFKQAVDYLITRYPFVAPLKESKKIIAVKAKTPGAADSRQNENLNKLAEQYHASLLQKQQALEYLAKRGITDIEVIRKFKIGYVNGYVTFPFFDDKGTVGEIYSRAINENIKLKHKYLPGPHAGILNLDELKISEEIYLCECVIDAISLYSMGIKNVTCTFGKGNVTEELVQNLTKYCKGVNIVYDNDGENDAAAMRTAETLAGKGLICERVQLPAKIKDCNDYLTRALAEKKELAEIKYLFGKLQKVPCVFPEKDSIPQNSTENTALRLVKDDYGIFVFEAGERQYIVKGLNLKKLCDLRIYLKAVSGDYEQREQINLMNTRDKERFARKMKERCAYSLSEYDVLDELEQLSAWLEAYQEKRYIEDHERALSYLRKKHVMTPAEEERAKKNLREKDYITDVLLTDLEEIGITGEEHNKMLFAIAAISRLDKYPVHVLLVSSSGSGKSQIQRAVLSFLPETEVFRLSRSTENVLYYMEPGALMNKIISIDEVSGAGGGNFYSYRTLMSEGKLEILYTGKDESGRLRAMSNLVQGPAVVFMATTNADRVDDETKNRQLNVYGDESPGQTERIVDSIFEHDNTESGDEKAALLPGIIKKHQDMHSLIRPLRVYVPREFKKYILTFGKNVQARRNARIYGSVLRSIARSRQYQREVFTNSRGEEYIVATLEDVHLANELLGPVFREQVSDLKGPERAFYENVRKYVEEHRGEEKRTEFRFSAKEIRLYTGLSTGRTWDLLTKLVRMEYLVRVCKGSGSTAAYRLAE